MIQTISRVSEDELTLQTYNFKLCNLSEVLTFKFVSFLSWRREEPGEAFDNSPNDCWYRSDILEKSTVEKPEVPVDVLDEAKRFILSRMNFDI